MLNPFSDLPFALHAEGFTAPFYADCDPHAFTRRESLVAFGAPWGAGFVYALTFYALEVLAPAVLR